MMKVPFSKKALLRRDGGFTLIELMISIIISGILLFAAGAVLVETQTGWTRSAATAQTFEDDVFFRNFIEFQIQASSGTYILNPDGSALSYIGFSNNDIYAHNRQEVLKVISYAAAADGSGHVIRYEEFPVIDAQGHTSPTASRSEDILKAVTIDDTADNPYGSDDFTLFSVVEEADENNILRNRFFRVSAVYRRRKMGSTSVEGGDIFMYNRVRFNVRPRVTDEFNVRVRLS